MSATKTLVSRPAPATRVLTTVQWTMTALLLAIVLGSGGVLLMSELTALSVATILQWQPEFPLVMLVVAAGVGMVGGAYWPVFNGEAVKRERELTGARFRSAKYLAVVLCFLGPFSLINVVSVMGFVTNLFVFGGFLLICVYTYVYADEYEPEPAS